MNFNGMGDFAQGYVLRQRTADLKLDMARLTSELTSGQVSDVSERVGGNFSFLSDVARRSTVLESYRVATAEAQHFAGTMQEALGHFGDTSQSLSTTLITAGTGGSGATSLDVAAQARSAFETMVSTLNSDVAGRALFSGNATDRAALATPDAILADLTAAIAGATTPTDIMSQVQAWFASPTGFAATAYLGSDDPLAGFVVGPDNIVQIDLRATDPALVGMMASAAVAALAGDPVFALDATEQAELFSLAGQEALTNADDVITLQARVGLAEAGIEQATTRNAASVTSLEMARNSLLEADPYETATKLEEVQFQLQSLYSVTVRMQQLSLVNFL